MYRFSVRFVLNWLIISSVACIEDFSEKTCFNDSVPVFL